MKYVPTSWPGARLPHIWLADGAALHDRIGDGYTLLCLGGAGAKTAAVAQAFASYSAPFSVIEIDEDRPRDIYGYDLLLLRPDLHVVGAAMACRMIRKNSLPWSRDINSRVQKSCKC